MQPTVCLPTCRCGARTRELGRSPTDYPVPPAVRNRPRRPPGRFGKRPSLRAGTRLGPYEILSRLGVGGMGEVYRARDVERGGEVAIKVPRREAAPDLQRRRRFEREARAASALDHPNTVAIHDVDEEGGLRYIAMELVEGKTLRDRMSKGAVPMGEMLPIAIQIAQGLAEIHAAGIVHRDLKPGNIMVTEAGLVKILDFGLARYLAQGQHASSEVTTVPEVTQAGVILGTVPYMSPEQAVGRAVEFRSDQFSLGSILYEMATGRRAFKKDSAPQTLAAIIEMDPEPVRGLNHRIPVELAGVIRRCLSKRPEGRYHSTQALADALAEIPFGQTGAVSA